jgi:hypothetical protein
MFIAWILAVLLGQATAKPDLFIETNKIKVGEYATFQFQHI